MPFRARWKRPLILIGAVSFPLLVGAVQPAFIEQVRTFTGSALSPLFDLQTRIIHTLKASVQALQELSSLRAKNTELQTQVRDLKAQVAQLAEMKFENDRLAALLQVKNDLPQKSVAARVTGRDPSHWSQYVTIDKGRAHGVRDETVLIHPDGLAGKVIAAGPYSSRAILLIDRHARVSAMNQRTRDVGLVEGQDTLELRMTYLDRDAKIEVGDVVISSGLGGIYPKGIPIGTVHMIGRAEDELTLYAVVKPFVPFSRLEEVLCLSRQNKN